MNHFLVATHSTLAEGFCNSVTLLIGKHANLRFINAYLDDSDWTGSLDDYFKDYSVNDSYIIFTDIYGGSVDQKVVQYKQKYEFILVAGVNLPILLESLLYDKKINEKTMNEFIEKGRESLQLVKPDLKTTSNIDDDFLV